LRKADDGPTAIAIWTKDPMRDLLLRASPPWVPSGVLTFPTVPGPAKVGFVRPCCGLLLFVRQPPNCSRLSPPTSSGRPFCQIPKRFLRTLFVPKSQPYQFQDLDFAPGEVRDPVSLSLFLPSVGKNLLAPFSRIRPLSVTGADPLFREEQSRGLGPFPFSHREVFSVWVPLQTICD